MATDGDIGCLHRIKLFLDERFQPGYCDIPLLGDAVEGKSRFVERMALELEEIFAAMANAADQANILQDTQVFGDRLARECRAFGECRYGGWRALAEFCQQRQTGRIAQREEYRGEMSR